MVNSMEYDQHTLAILGDESDIGKDCTQYAIISELGNGIRDEERSHFEKMGYGMGLG
jgi:hypothetical protein